MGKYIRILLVIVVVLGIVLLANSQAAWAADSTHQAKNSGLAVPLAQHDPCEKPNGMQGKDNNRCQAGSVLPPDDDIQVCERGNYSVGGIATLDINNLRGDGCLTAYMQDRDAVPGRLPKGTSTIVSEILALTLPTKGANLQVCFAVPPGQAASIYFADAGSWVAVKTHIKDGIACAEVQKSGNYALVSP